MSDDDNNRNDYMREYMREYRAKKRAEKNGTTEPAPITTTRRRAAAAETTEGSGPAAAVIATAALSGGPGVKKWVWWLVAGLVIGAAVYGCVYMVKHSTPEQRAAFLDTLTDNPLPAAAGDEQESQGDTTEPAPINGDSTEQEGQENTEPGQE